MRVLSLVFVLTLVAGTATAQSARPSPCDHYLATGEKLPRQDTAKRRTLIVAVPNPTWRDRPIATAYPDEPVTVLQECGLKLKIRTIRGEEGWVPIGLFPNEVRLRDRARRKPPETDAECEQRLAGPHWRPLAAGRRLTPLGYFGQDEGCGGKRGRVASATRDSRGRR